MIYGIRGEYYKNNIRGTTRIGNDPLCMRTIMHSAADNGSAPRRELLADIRFCARPRKSIRPRVRIAITPSATLCTVIHGVLVFLIGFFVGVIVSQRAALVKR